MRRRFVSPILIFLLGLVVVGLPLAVAQLGTVDRHGSFPQDRTVVDLPSDDDDESSDDGCDGVGDDTMDAEGPLELLRGSINCSASTHPGPQVNRYVDFTATGDLTPGSFSFNGSGPLEGELGEAAEACVAELVDQALTLDCTIGSMHGFDDLPSGYATRGFEMLCEARRSVLVRTMGEMSRAILAGG